MSATALKERLRVDLKAAMQARRAGEVSLLRTLIAALDNAEAVPTEQKRHIPRVFGHPGSEVTRRVLDDEAVDALLGAETDARLAAASAYASHGREEDAARLRDEAALIGRYRA